MIELLSDEFKFKRFFLLKYSFKLLNIPRIFLIFLYYKFIYTGNLILTNQTTWLAGFRSNNLAIVHHIDSKSNRGLSGIYQNFCDNYLFKYKKRFNKIVTVAKYWKDELISKGFNNISIIYNSFDTNLYKFSEKEVFEFKRKYNLTGRPIIYLGNCQRKKGVVEAYETLKDLDCYFITTGIKDVAIPANHFNFNYHDYRLMLSSVDIVICMSNLLEGWNRTAHEALLSNTQVVGSGKGGMKELLEMGGGTICSDLSKLHDTVEHLLNNPINSTHSKIFNLDNVYFKAQWEKTLNDFLSSSENK